MNYRFDTKLFIGRKGRIGKIVDEYTKERDFAHLHLGVYQGNTKLAECASMAIEESDMPVMYSRSGVRRTQLLPAEELPSAELPDVPYVIENDEIYVRLDRLPFMYTPRSAHEGGLGKSENFMRPFLELRQRMSGDLEGMNFSHRIRSLARAPDIMNAARLSVFSRENSIYGQSLRYGLSKEGVNFPVSPSHYYNILYLKGVGSETMKFIIRRFGGWADYSVCGSGGEDAELVAIMSRAWISDSSEGSLAPRQKRFIKAVYEAFEIDQEK